MVRILHCPVVWSLQKECGATCVTDVPWKCISRSRAAFVPAWSAPSRSSSARSQKYGPPVYVRHEIVHNKYVVESLKAKGAIFVEDLSEVPPAR